MFAYTVAGLVSATIVGTILGWAGSLFPGRLSSEWAAILLFLSLLFAIREFELVSFPLPQRYCQTERVWAMQFHIVGAAVMWGFHIGLGFATRITYGGFWILVAAVVVVGESRFGAELMGVYWLGRALSVWIAPAMAPAGGTAWAALLKDIAQARALFRQTSAWGLVWSAGLSLFLWLTTVKQ